MDGFILIDKPAGITSHDVIDRLRRITGIRKIGHAGTLDPFATGLLVVGVGREATKRLGEFLGADKEYVGTLVLGARSDTQDGTGAIMPEPDAIIPSQAAVEMALKKFTGPLQQTPPMYSAKKIQGKKLYELAREGKEVAREPVAITVRAFELTGFEPPRATFRVNCSSGTYVRTLAHDLGNELGAGAYLETLRRTKIGGLRIEDAAKLSELTPENWRARLVNI
ncbi:MAG: tRNA pseudouridine(55) synthase TruB [Patescibacteria group bacterium]